MRISEKEDFAEKTFAIMPQYRGVCMRKIEAHMTEIADKTFADCHKNVNLPRKFPAIRYLVFEPADRHTDMNDHSTSLYWLQPMRGKYYRI